jgi:hypothetical protein
VTKATGGNQPKVIEPERKKAPKPKKPPKYSYSYDHKTGRYSMDGASLLLWLMDVEGRARLEKKVIELQNRLDAVCERCQEKCPHHKEKT